jgi:Kef-type K+ transport system membrane component KefB
MRCAPARSPVFSACSPFASAVVGGVCTGAGFGAGFEGAGAVVAGAVVSAGDEVVVVVVVVELGSAGGFASPPHAMTLIESAAKIAIVFIVFSSSLIKSEAVLPRILTPSSIRNRE